MDQSLNVTNIKNEPTESTSSDQLEISSNMKMNTIKQENNYIIHNELDIKIKSQEDENEFLVSASTSCNKCSNYDIEIKTEEPLVKIEYENMLDGSVQDPLDVRDEIKGEKYIPTDFNEEPRIKTEPRDGEKDEHLLESDENSESYGNALNLHDQQFSRNKLGCKDKKHICNVCNKTFTLKHNLVTHIHIHTGEKPFRCNICKIAFSRKGSLDIHMIIHSGEKPYSCDICKKVFNRTSTLNSHKLIHSGVKPFSCKECNKTFTQKTNLVTHRRTHSGEKPFACDACEKTFADKSTLNKHKRTHTGEKPYSCDFCNKSFARKSNLNQHKKTHNI